MKSFHSVGYVRGICAAGVCMWLKWRVVGQDKLRVQTHGPVHNKPICRGANQIISSSEVAVNGTVVEVSHPDSVSLSETLTARFMLLHLSSSEGIMPISRRIPELVLQETGFQSLPTDQSAPWVNPTQVSLDDH